jgi:phage terminase large subunit-like protein
VRVYYLNQRVQAEHGLLSIDVWNQGARPIATDLFFSGRNVAAGLDLSSRIDLTAIVFAVEDDDGDVHLLPFAWTPADTILSRSARDRAPYDVWQRQGLVETVPGSAIDYDFVAQKIAEIAAPMNLAKLAYDRWRIEIMRQSMARIGFAANLVEFGQGFKDMSPAVEIFEELAMMGKIVHGNHPILKWCIGNAVVEMDAAGNRKLTKAPKKMFGRIDVAVAALMAVGALKGGDPFVDVAALVA